MEQQNAVEFEEYWALLPAKDPDVYFVSIVCGQRCMYGFG